jgi:type VII secretion protein EssA
MQKKVRQMTLVVCLLGVLQGAPLHASDDGTLQLNPQIMTDSDGGVSISNDFPIRNELFTAELNERTQAQMQDDVVEQRKTLTFSGQHTDALYQLDTSEATERLFMQYQPVVLSTGADETSEEALIWYWLFALLALPLIIVSVTLGKRRAKRSVRKQR